MTIEKIITHYTEETGIKGIVRNMEKTEHKVNGITATRFNSVCLPNNTLTVTMSGNYLGDPHLTTGNKAGDFYFYHSGKVYRVFAEDGAIRLAKSSLQGAKIVAAAAKSMENVNYAWDQLRAKGATIRKDYGDRNSYLDVDGKLFPAHCAETYNRLFALRAITKEGKITKRRFPIHAFADRMHYITSTLSVLSSAGVLK